MCLPLRRSTLINNYKEEGNTIALQLVIVVMSKVVEGPSNLDSSTDCLDGGRKLSRGLAGVFFELERIAGVDINKNPSKKGGQNIVELLLGEYSVGILDGLQWNVE